MSLAAWQAVFALFHTEARRVNSYVAFPRGVVLYLSSSGSRVQYSNSSEGKTWTFSVRVEVLPCEAQDSVEA